MEHNTGTKEKKAFIMSGNGILKITFFIAFISVMQTSCGQHLTNSPEVHDPVMIQENNKFYMFCTGWGISMFSSDDMVNWKVEKPVFKEIPEWTKQRVTDFRGHIWAPDIFYHKGTYYLYYSVSSFAKNTSCIGLVTNTTLDPDSSDYSWVDQGLIVESVPGRDMWNAIDPNIIEDDEGAFWMSFGSFWDGIKLVKLDSNLTKVAERPAEWHSLSSRARSFNIQDTKPGDGAVEAPFIFKKGEYYYLFVSFDYCCRGKDSNYKVMVGRSKIVTGPYLDKAGLRMDQGGGSLVISGNHKWAGVGHSATYTFNDKDWLIFHAYDLQDDGKPKLLIKEISWDNNGWPSVTLD